MENKEFKTIKYFRASQLENVNKTSEATASLDGASPEDNIAVLLAITNPLKIEKAVNITKEGFGKIQELIPV